MSSRRIAVLGGAAVVALILGYAPISRSELRATAAGKQATVVAYRGSEMEFVAYVQGDPSTPLDVVMLTENGATGRCRLTQTDRTGD